MRCARAAVRATKFSKAAWGEARSAGRLGLAWQTRQGCAPAPSRGEELVSEGQGWKLGHHPVHLLVIRTPRQEDFPLPDSGPGSFPGKTWPPAPGDLETKLVFVFKIENDTHLTLPTPPRSALSPGSLNLN